MSEATPEKTSDRADTKESKPSANKIQWDDEFVLAGVTAALFYVVGFGYGIVTAHGGFWDHVEKAVDYSFAGAVIGAMMALRLN